MIPHSFRKLGEVHGAALDHPRQPSSGRTHVAILLGDGSHHHVSGRADDGRPVPDTDLTGTSRTCWCTRGMGMQKRVNHTISIYNYTTTTSVFSFFTSSLMPPPLLLVFIVVLESCSHDCHEIELAADALKPAHTHTPENNGFFVLLCAEQHKNFIGIIKLLEQTSSSRGKDHHIT